jgi:transcriptional regulator with XRE-family HTH domain
MTIRSLASKRRRKGGSTGEPPLSRLVRDARGAMSQERFAARLSISQESLSRYEIGRVEPPVYIVAKCWELLEQRRDVSSPPASELSERVKDVRGADHVAVREVIARLIDISVGKGKPGRKSKG